MDQPHNQFLYKEFAYSHITRSIAHSQLPVYNSGHMFKINLYSTGNIDLFKKDVGWSDWGGNNDPTRFISMFYSTPKVLTFDSNPGQMPIMVSINNYLDKITFVPTEHVASFHISKVPISYDILHFIESILERRKGDVTDADFDVIRYSLQKETESMELYNRVTHLNKIIIALLYLIAAIVFWIVVYFIMCKIYKKYEELYMEYYNL